MHRTDPLEIDDGPDDYIGIRYRIVRVDRGRRRVVARSLLGEAQARRRQLYQAGAFALRRAVAAGEAVAGGDVIKVPADMLPGDDGPVLRLHLPDGPVDFLVEEDTCAGDPDME